MKVGRGSHFWVTVGGGRIKFREIVDSVFRTIRSIRRSEFPVITHNSCFWFPMVGRFIAELWLSC